MRIGLALTLSLVLITFPGAAFAIDRPADPDVMFEFTYMNPTGGLTAIDDFTVRWYELELTLAPPPGYTNIEYLEFEILGLTHDSPGDLNVFLLDPHGGGIEVIDDSGDGFGIMDARVLFSDVWDNAVPLSNNQIQPFPPTIYEPTGPGLFWDYYGEPIGTDPWIAVVIDDFEQGDAGSFQELILRGVVPEPMSLTLLGLGAVVALRRRRS
jgi:hypothetical protein